MAPSAIARRPTTAACLSLVLCAVLLRTAIPGVAQGIVALPNPILFVTQVPVPYDFTSVGALFGNHQGALWSVARGGDLWIRYVDGTLKNLTQTAGYGTSGMQGSAAIAVREPSVHWSGTKAVFSMVVGAPTAQYQVRDYYWQLYEVTGLGPADTPVITKVPNQPANYNNVSPVYGTDDRIIFTSDRPRNGDRATYPQLDEYEEAPVVSGLWSLNPSTGDLFLVQHSPSGSFSPQIDSFGRLVYIRWDHLQRDQQADADAVSNAGYGTFNYSSESGSAQRLNDRTEIFPEPRSSRTDLLAGTNLEGHTFNDFFPWMVNEDGTEEETLNHLGRHELLGYFNRSLKDDPNLVEHSSARSRTNPNPIENFIQIKEDPSQPGIYFGIDAPEFSTHASGQVIRINAAPNVNPDQTIVTYVTHRDTHSYTNTPSANHSGLYRNPLPLTNGMVIAVHTPETRADANTGTRQSPGSRYAYRMKVLAASGAVFVAGPSLTTGITKSVQWWDPDVLVSYSGPLWELDPVEVRARTRPIRTHPPLSAPIQQVLNQQGVTLSTLQDYLRSNDLALIVSNNVTTRDRADRQQPFNLRVAGTSTQSIGAPGKVYDISHLQVFQADLLRGIGGTTSPRPGRRVLAQFMRDSRNPPLTGAPAASVAIAADGSVAAFVPARRAISWQLTAPGGTPVVRERYWITMQPGEVRVCGSCHGANTRDQANLAPPANQPEALRQLLAYWKDGANGPPPVQPPTGPTTPPATPTAPRRFLTDGDGDGKSEIAVYRPSIGGWFIRSSAQNYSTATASFYQWGLPGDLPAAADFDGDGKIEINVFRPSTGQWFMRYSMQSYSLNTPGVFQWGLPGDVPIAGDFDGDGKSEIAVYRPSIGGWFIRSSGQSYSAATASVYQWGLPGDLPVAADFDGDGKSELSVFRPSTGQWFIRYSAQAYNASTPSVYQWGLPGDVPLAADFDADGKNDLAVFRPSNGGWFIRYSAQGYSTATASFYQWGLPGDVPIAADFDGDGKVELCVFRPPTGQWFIRYSTQNYGASTPGMYQWGLPGDLPIKP